MVMVEGFGICVIIVSMAMAIWDLFRGVVTVVLRCRLRESLAMKVTGTEVRHCAGFDPVQCTDPCDHLNCRLETITCTPYAAKGKL